MTDICLNKPAALLKSGDIHAAIDELLISGAATTALAAEKMFLDNHLMELVLLLDTLNDAELRQHEAIRLLFFHGGRRLEDAL